MHADKTHDDLIADWTKNAESHDDANYNFLRSLKRNCTSREEVGRIALKLHQEAFSIVDCTKCANCCRTLRVPVTAEDIARIAQHLGTAPDAFMATYLERDEKEGGYWIKTKPCPFLGQDSKCTIYDMRPENCQGYPFTDKDFLDCTMTHANNAVVCPAVFYVVEQMKARHRGQHDDFEPETGTVMSTHLWKRLNEHRFGNSKLVDFLKEHGASMWNQPVMDVSASAFRAALENAKELGLTKSDIVFIKKELKDADNEDTIDSYDIS